jgi:hypothetical protein
VEEMEEKEKVLLDKLFHSEKYRLKCQEDYDNAKRRNLSFYKNKRKMSSGKNFSLNSSRADIFIS